MLCKKCGRTIEPGFESTGICEDCNADSWGHAGAYDEDAPTEKEEEENILESFISNLGIGTRTTNCLYSHGIMLVGELMAQTEQDILRIKNLKDKSLQEIKTALAAVGLKLRERKKIIMG